MSNGRYIPGRSVYKRFMDFVDVAESGCWEWQGPRGPKGYGRFKVSGKNVAAHRISYFMHKAIMLGRDNHVCHSCDNPRCVNPDHLWHGSNADNVADRVTKQRQHSKLTKDDVYNIRMRWKRCELQKDLADEFGVAVSTISMVVNGLRWKHVD